MKKKIQIGILLILIGIGTPSVLAFFQNNGTLFTVRRMKKIFAPNPVSLSIDNLSKSLVPISQSLEELLKNKKYLRSDTGILFMADIDAAAYFIKKANDDITTAVRGISEEGLLWVFDYYIPFKYSIGIGLILMALLDSEWVISG